MQRFLKNKTLACGLLIGLATVGLSLGLAPSAHANVQNFKIISFEADYYLERQANGVGAMAVTERIVAEFPDIDQNRGIYRYLPNKYKKANLGIRLDSITQDGQPAKYETSSVVNPIGDSFTTYKIGDGDKYVHGQVTYEIKYWLQNVISTPDDNSNIQELYWDINGHDWHQTFDKVLSRIHIPADLKDQLLPSTGQACYTGPQGSTAKKCRMNRTSNQDGSLTVTTETKDMLGKGHNLTVAIAFKKDTFTNFEDTQDAKNILLAFNGLQLAVVALAIKGLMF